MNPPIPGMKLRPYGEEFMIDAFMGCFAFAAHNDEIKDAFIEQNPDYVFSPPRSAIDRMIDKATGRTDDVIAKFADFVAQNLWGLEGDIAAQEMHEYAETMEDIDAIEEAKRDSAQ